MGRENLKSSILSPPRKFKIHLKSHKIVTKAVTRLHQNLMKRMVRKSTRGVLRPYSWTCWITENGLENQVASSILTGKVEGNHANDTGSFAPQGNFFLFCLFLALHLYYPSGEGPFPHTIPLESDRTRQQPFKKIQYKPLHFTELHLCSY